MASEGDIVT